MQEKIFHFQACKSISYALARSHQAWRQIEAVAPTHQEKKNSKEMLNCLSAWRQTKNRTLQIERVVNYFEWALLQNKINVKPSCRSVPECHLTGASLWKQKGHFAQFDQLVTAWSQGQKLIISIFLSDSNSASKIICFDTKHD